MRSVVRGLKAHQDPEAATEGLGGTYFFRNEAGAKIAIMKPCDEEPLAPNNPKGFVGRQLGEPGLKPTVRVGEAASREVAAYLLDHDHFAKVPHTVMVRMSHPIFHVAPQASAPKATKGKCEEVDDLARVQDLEVDDDLPLKLGSLQEFVPHECDTSELGASRYSVRDVQRIGILDVRLLNTDRHAGNILVRHIAPSYSSSSAVGGATGGSFRSADAQGALAGLSLQDHYELIPIDHGFALPESLEPPYFEWQHWPQAMMPFGAEELEYIARLDPKADADLLRRELPCLREESLRVLEVSTTLLKRCAAAGLSLSEIATVVTRPLFGLDDDEPSELEKICESVRNEIAAEIAASLSDADSQSDEEELSDLSDVEEEAQPFGAAADVLLEVEAGNDQDRSESIQESDSPGAESAATHFGMLGDSDVSRHTAVIDDVLFSMDEDASGMKTPAPGSPDIPRGLARLKAHAPSLRVRRTGEIATPGAVVGMSFGSALASATSVSPPASSYDSDSSPGGGGGHGGGGPRGTAPSIESVGRMTMAAFKGPATYVPGFATGMKAAQRPGKARQRRRLGVRNNGRHKHSRNQAYPPLVEPRSGNASSIAPFTGLSGPEWDHFMRVFIARVDDALHAGAWVQSSGNGQGPLMSCPKF